MSYKFYKRSWDNLRANHRPNHYHYYCKILKKNHESSPNQNFLCSRTRITPNHMIRNKTESESLSPQSTESQSYRNIEIVKILLATKDIDVNLCARMEQTPLQSAINMNRFAIANILRSDPRIIVE